MLVLLTILLVSVVVPGVFSGGLPATCYNVQGHAMPGWLPCDSGATTSVCCGQNDSCLSNGLCLNAGANNDYSQQGCTDADWGAAVHMVLPDRDRQLLGALAVRQRRPAGRPAPLLGGPTAYVQPAHHEVHAQGVFPRQELET